MSKFANNVKCVVLRCHDLYWYHWYRTEDSPWQWWWQWHCTADNMEHETWNILRDNYSLSPLTWWETLLSTNTSKEYILWSVHVLNISDLGTTSKYTTIDCHAAFHLPTVNTLHLVICGWNLDNYGVIDFILYLHPYNYLSMFQICAL